MECRSVRAVLDCEVAIRAITMAVIRARERRRVRRWVARGEVPWAPDLPPEQEVRDAALLQEALRADPASLDAWLIGEVGTELDVVGIPDAALGWGEDVRILERVVERLPPAVRHRLREAMAGDDFILHVEELLRSFDVTIQGLRLQHVDGPGASPRTGWSRSLPTRSRSSESDGTIERRRVRAVVDCEVEIREITMAAIEARRERWFQRQIARGYLLAVEIPDPPSERAVEDAALLQEALRSDRARLDAWLLDEVATVLAIEGVEVAEAPEGEVERILMPVIERLPPARRHRLREAAAKDRLIEVVEEFFNSFRVSFRGVEYEHVGAGDTRPGAFPP